jgi:hypothetical protein
MWGGIMFPTRKLKNNMLRRILLYFMLFCCLLTKDGLSYAFDVLKKTVDVSVLSDPPCEDTLEEEGAPEDWLTHAALLNVNLQLQIPNLKKTSFPERNESELNVLLEQVSPPPRLA